MTLMHILSMLSFSFVTHLILAQWTIPPVNNLQIASIQDIKQLTNTRIRIISNTILLSSTDGLNILRGQNLEVLRQSPSGLYDSNIQSDFYPDSNQQIWFCTFHGFNAYHPISRTLKQFRVTDHNGDTLTSEYRIMGLMETNLFLHVGEEIIRFDVMREEVTGRWCLGPCLECAFVLVKEQNHHVLYTGNADGLEIMTLQNNGDIDDCVLMPDFPASDLLAIDGIIWVAERDSSLSKVIDRRIIRRQKMIGSPRTLSRHQDNLIINYGDQISFYNTRTEAESAPLTFLHECTQLTSILDVEIDKDSILWVSSDGEGVFTTDLKTPFNDFVQSAADVEPPNTTKIGATPDEEQFVLFSRNRGALVLNKTGQVLGEYRHDQYGDIIETRRATEYNNGFLYYNWQAAKLKLLDPPTGRTRNVLYTGQDKFAPAYYQLGTLNNDTVIGSSSTRGVGILSIDEKQSRYTFHPFALPRDIAKVYTYFHEANDGSLYISYNEEFIHVYAPDSLGSYQYSATLALSGGVWGFYQYPQDSMIYIGNSNGLYRINARTHQFAELSDGKLLPMNIYCILGDTLQNLWMSTNSGILGYHLPSDTAQLFVEKDGVSSREFNGHSVYQDAAGRMYFGGTEGVTVFNPYDVRLSRTRAPVDVYAFRINDELMEQYSNPDTMRTLSLPYKYNTLSFEFQAIDYADPAATRVKYKMTEYDNHWIEAPTSRGFARYANMRPGHYTFSLAGANADGVYSDEMRTIAITVNPPFYMTWWFRITASAFILGVGYWIIRSYYRRKLERKDLLLKQQSLLIEKQRAVEYERNRIAAEMHDDLGAGLTRIKYLSERALRMVDNEKESEQIKRIADQSNALVTNMSEIIWAMNSRFDTAESLTGYIRRYASEYLEENHLPLSFESSPDGHAPVTAEKRRNIFLVVKEVLHNTVKYAQAESVDIVIPVNPTNYKVIIREKNSIGFDPEHAKEKGNGLYNMQKRMQTVGGTISFHRDNNDMVITINTPL